MLNRPSQPFISLPWNWLAAIAGCLLFIHVGLDFQQKNYGHLSISLLFWIAIGALLSDRRSQFKWGSDLISVVTGAVLLVGLVSVAISTPRGIVLGFYPFAAAVGLALLASGVRNILQYQKELFGLLCLGIPKLVSAQTFDISPITASFTATLMWYSGFPIQRQGIQLILPPSGAVNVVAECSGLNLMLYMFGVSVVCLMLFPTSKRNRILLPIFAIALGFFLNSIRVALLAFLSAASNQNAFDYWHSEEGALFFVLLSVGLFGLLCWVLLGLQKK